MGEDTSTSQSQSAADSDSGEDDDMITPRPGPSAPEQRTSANLSKPVRPSVEAFSSTKSFRDWSTDNVRERAATDTEDESGKKEGGQNARPGDEKAAGATSAVSRGREIQQHEVVTVPLENSKKGAENTSPTAKRTPALSTSPKRTSPKATYAGASKSTDVTNTKSGTSPTSSLQIRSSSASERQRSVSFHPSSIPRAEQQQQQQLQLPSQQPSYSAYMLSRRSSNNTSPFSGARTTEETESSADENTAIFRRSNSAKSGIGTGVVAAAGGTTYGTASGVNNGSARGGGYDGEAEEDCDAGPEDSFPRRRKSGSTPKAGNGGSGRPGVAAGSRRSTTDRNRGEGAGLADDSGSEKDSWWKVMVEKYGTVELENKGSVARDHLALGKHLVFSISTHTDHIRSNRTHLSSLAPHISLIRLDRDSSHPALPPKHQSPNLGRSILDTSSRHAPSKTSRQTPRRHFSRHLDLDPAAWISSLL